MKTYPNQQLHLELHVHCFLWTQNGRETVIQEIGKGMPMCKLGVCLRP